MFSEISRTLRIACPFPMSLIDRAGQTIKFVCPVPKPINDPGYFRRLANALENNQKKKAIDPSIIQRTGRYEGGFIHTHWEMWMDFFHAQYIDDRALPIKTTTDVNHTYYNQQTYESILQMTDCDITLTYQLAPITEYMCDDFFSIEGFIFNELYMDKDICSLKRKDQGMTITDDEITIEFYGNSIVIDRGGVHISGEEIDGSASGGAGFSSSGGSMSMNGSSVNLN